MRIVLADLQSPDGLVTKDTVAGGYGSRLVPFSRVTRVYCYYKKRRVGLPSIQLGYLAAILARRGHEVVFTRDSIPDADVAIILSSLVDYRRETRWAELARQRGMRVGFIGLAASKLPQLFEDHADFVVLGEPEAAAFDLASGAKLSGRYPSPALKDLNALPFPRWDLLEPPRRLLAAANFPRVPVLTSRGCPEFCTYCPHRIQAPFRSRSVENVVDELEYISESQGIPYVVFRDALFSENRERCLALCDEILARGLRLRFACETRLDSLDPDLLRSLKQAGLSAVSFGVETVSARTLRKAGRRPIPEAHQRAIVEACHRLGIITIGYYVFGFLQDDWDSAAATIDYAISLGTTFAQFKLMTPYPGTPMWKQLEPLVFEKDWQMFDGYTVTFRHPKLSAEELRFLLGAAYARFYARPGFLVNYYRLRDFISMARIEKLDRRVLGWHAKREMALVSRAVEC